MAPRYECFIARGKLELLIYTNQRKVCKRSGTKNDTTCHLSPIRRLRTWANADDEKNNIVLGALIISARPQEIFLGRRNPRLAAPIMRV